MHVRFRDGQPQGAEPHPLGAEAEGGGHLLSAADAARRQYGQRVDGVDDFGVSTIEAISPVWPPAS